MFRRQWMAQSAAVVSFAKDTQEIFVPDSTCYYPGELYMSAHSTHGSITQRLNFTSASTALLRIEADTAEDLLLSGSQWGKDITVSVEQNSVIARHPSGETVTVTFTPNVELAKTDNNYTALVRSPRYPVNVAISFFTSEKEMTAGLQNLPGLLNNPTPALQANAERWEGYLTKILRKDMKPEYDRIAVKAVTTLISNWRTHRGGLLHEGIIPSHAVGYFVGFWAWDSWRFSAGTAKFDPELAKNNIRAMFDYQQPDGMIIDCIYTDPPRTMPVTANLPWYAGLSMKYLPIRVTPPSLPRCIRNYSPIINGGTKSATTTAMACANTVLPTEHWKLPPGKAVWTTPSVLTAP